MPLTITYEDEDGNVERQVELPDAPTSILHAAPWVDMLINIFDPHKDGNKTVDTAKDISTAEAKFLDAWENASDRQKRDLLILLHDQFGLSLKNISVLFGISDGKVRYAYWKLVTQ